MCPEMLPEKLGTLMRKMKVYGCLSRQNYRLSEVIIFEWSPPVSVKKLSLSSYRLVEEVSFYSRPAESKLPVSWGGGA